MVACEAFFVSATAFKVGGAGEEAAHGFAGGGG